MSSLRLDAEIERPPQAVATEESIFDRPWVRFGREVCGDLGAGLRREWLVTNGLGGYASSTLAGINTRRYHGLLVAALEPPVKRTVLVGSMLEQATYDGRTYAMSAHEFGDGTIAGHGYLNLQSFHLEGSLPVWTFALADALVERRLWMAHRENTTFVTYRVLRSTREVKLRLTPLITYRDFHALTSGKGWRPRIEAGDRGFAVDAFEGASAFHIEADYCEFRSGGDWYWNFLHREESARGLDDRADLFAAGEFVASIAEGETLSLVLTTEGASPGASAPSLDAERQRQRDVLEQADAATADIAVQQLTLAADQFLVRRGNDAEDSGRTVIAGYHWFNDWGRDTMISLPGLTLSTGRAKDAADILRTFAHYIADGLLPNNFPERSGSDPGYNTADATLWYVLAIRAYHEATGDAALVSDLLPVLRDIVDHHVAGTRFGIGVDPVDGLLRAGEPGWQITWMDAKVGDWVVTPRIGKPVEINALWYNVLRTTADFLRQVDSTYASALASRAEDVRTAFLTRFHDSSREWLADVVDGPDGDDWTLRPNQIFAVSLPFPLLQGPDAERVVASIGRALLTSYGLRSLAPGEPAYRGDYGGDQLRRDGGYHQGPVWSWLSGPFAEAHFRVHGDAAAALALLIPSADHLTDAGLGTISEILEGDPPHLPRGCIAQAWGVAETLRVWRLLEGR